MNFAQRVTGLGPAFLVVLAACVDASDRPGTWAYLYPRRSPPRCATSTCHSDLAARAGVVLDDADGAYQALLAGTSTSAGPFVFPGDDLRSPLVLILTGTERARMPPEAPLAEGELELVRRWIRDGAAP
ncbi:MAG: hypothetical protein IPL61_00005 [Myxococcales bacterium]|nr:hypothetical protein [Myxococcales bacterium]